MSVRTEVLKGRTVLVVEDQYLNAIEAQRLVAALGGQTLGPAPTVKRALELIGERRPDFAILDVNLGDERVFPVADALRETGVPFVFVSGYENSMIVDAYKTTPCLVKPLSRHELAEHAAALLG